MTKKLRANKRILKNLTEALYAAELRACGIPIEHQEAMRLYLETWVALPLRSAIREMCRGNNAGGG